MNRFINSARHHLIKIIEDGILPIENITDALNILKEPVTIDNHLYLKSNSISFN